MSLKENNKENIHSIMEEPIMLHIYVMYATYHCQLKREHRKN